MRIALALLRLALGLVTITALGLVLAGALGGMHAAADSLAHFRAHLSALAAAAASLMAAISVRRTRVFAAVLIALSVAGLFSTAAYMIPDDPDRPVPDDAYTLVTLNMQVGTDKRDAFDLLRAERADIVTLQEVTEAEIEGSPAATSAYAHRMFCPGQRAAGIAILSRYPLSEPNCIAPAAFLTAVAHTPDGSLRVATQHLSWPWPFPQRQNIAAVAGALRDMRGPVAIAGDFNAVPWSFAVQDYAALSGTQVVDGIGPTWTLSRLPAPWRRVAGLPIDNVLLAGLTKHRATRLDDVGSDHLPVRVSFTFDAAPIPGAPRERRAR